MSASIKQRTHRITCLKCVQISVCLLAALYCQERTVSVGNTNLRIITLLCFLPWIPNCKPHENRKSSRMPITVGMNVHLQCSASDSATRVLRGWKFRCFEGWISVRLQAPYISCPLSPCQYKTWPCNLPPCERSQSRAAKHPTSGQTFKTMFVFAQNVEGSQLNYGRNEVLRELLIEKLRHLFIEIAYINYCMLLVAILYQCRNMRHSSSYDLNSSAHNFRTT